MSPTAPPEGRRGLGPVMILFRIIGVLALTVLTLTTVVSVAWRYFLDDPIFGVEDVSSISLAVFVAAAVATAAWERSHIAVDLVTNMMSPPLQRLAAFIAALVGLGTVGLACYALISKGSCGQACGQFTANLSIPHMPFYFFFAAAFAFYALLLALDLIGALRPAGPSDESAL